MSRSRALNRFNRINAKRRRIALRADLSSFKEDSSEDAGIYDHADSLLQKALDNESLTELLESQALN